MNKICKKCNTIKALNDFYKEKASPDGLRSICKSCAKNALRAWRQQNPEKHIAASAKWKKLNRDKQKLIDKKWRENNKDKIKKSRLRYKSTLGFKTKRSEYQKQRLQSDINFKIKKNLRTRLWLALRGKIKKASVLELIDCDLENFKKYLESKFQNGMTWNNYGKWHIDHIIPCAAFDLSDLIQQKQCFHYTNLQPLWAQDNWAKGAKYGQKF